MYRFHRPWAISNRVSVLRSRHFSTKRTADWRCAFCRVTSLLRLLVYVVDISLNMIHMRQNIKEIAAEVIADCRLLFYCLRTTFTISQMSHSQSCKVEPTPSALPVCSLGRVIAINVCQLSGTSPPASAASHLFPSLSSPHHLITSRLRHVVHKQRGT